MRTRAPEPRRASAPSTRPSRREEAPATPAPEPAPATETGHRLGAYAIAPRGSGSGAPIQRAKGGRGSQQHHDPQKKKYLSKKQGRQQVQTSSRQLELIQQGMSRKEALRQAKAELRNR